MNPRQLTKRLLLISIGKQAVIPRLRLPSFWLTIIKKINEVIDLFFIWQIARNNLNEFNDVD